MSNSVAETLSKAWTEASDAAPSSSPGASPSGAASGGDGDIPSALPADAKPAVEETWDAPVEWDAKERESFSQWAPEIRQSVLTRLRNTEKTWAEKSAELEGFKKNYDPIHQLLEPRTKAWSAQGQTPDRVLKQLLDLSDVAGRDPKWFMRWYAQQQNLKPEDIWGGQQQFQPQTPDEWIDPQVQALQGELAQMKQALAQQGQGLNQFLGTIRQQQEAVRHAEIEAFRTAKGPDSKPIAPYYDQVEGDMAKLLRAGLATNIKDAYERAVYANPDVRAKVLADQRASERRKAETEQREHAAKAEKAGVTLRTGPANGADHSKPKKGRSVRAALDEAYNTLSARN